MTPELWKLLTDKESVRFWDIDGVLAQYEYSERNHNACKESEWGEFIKKNPHFYRDCVKPVEVVQDFLYIYGDSKRDFVISCTYDSFEERVKSEFVTHEYPQIPRHNIFRADNRKEKLLVMQNVLKAVNIDSSNPEKVIMVDDTTDVLSFIQENSDFTTVHISSFMDRDLINTLHKHAEIHQLERVCSYESV